MAGAVLTLLDAASGPARLLFHAVQDIAYPLAHKALIGLPLGGLCRVAATEQRLWEDEVTVIEEGFGQAA